MKKILLIFLGVFISAEAVADQPKDWQLGFQDPASGGKGLRRVFPKNTYRNSE